MIKLRRITIEIKNKERVPVSLSSIFNYSCYKDCILVFSITQNVEIEPLKTKAINL
jgi:hypothetical protein